MTASPGQRRRISSIAPGTGPAGSHAPEPVVFFDSGIPKSRTAGMPSSAISSS
jgi:hypothetical protein